MSSKSRFVIVANRLPVDEETTPAADADEPAGQDVVTRSDDAQTGLPGWVWVVVGLSVVGLLALLGVTWSRNRR